MAKEYTAKDMYFIKRIHFVESIKKAIDSPSEESIKIYDELLEHKEDQDITEYLEMIYANKGWDLIELNKPAEAKKCFEKWLELNPNNELIYDWISHIESFIKKL